MSENMDENDYIPHIRDKLQADISEQRSIKRSLLVNSRRANLEQEEIKLKLPSIQEFENLCSQYIRYKKPNQLQRIRLGLCCVQQYITKFLSTEGALYALVGSLTGGNAKLQLEAFYCFINIGFGTQIECFKCCEKAGIYFISLGSDNTHLQELSLWAFGNLCGSHPKVCNLARKQGLEPFLIMSINSENENIVCTAIYTLNLYLNTMQNRIKPMCTTELIKQLIKCFRKTKELIKDLSCCLFTISTSKDLCTYLVNFGVVAESIQTLSQNINNEIFDVNVATPLVRLLTNIVAVVNNVAIELCYQADLFVLICNHLLRSSYPHLHTETIQLIANVINAAKSLPETGEKILEDSNLKRQLEPALRRSFASHFLPIEPVMIFN